MTPLCDLLESPRPVDWEEVYDYYAVCEFEKWLRLHGIEAARTRLMLVQDKVRSCGWVRGKASVAVLFPVHMCPGTNWIQRLACPSHHVPEPPHSLANTPTLADVVRNLERSAPAQPEVAKKIEDLRALLRDGLLLTPHAIVIDDPREAAHPYFFDGNTRIIALAGVPEWMDRHVFIYYGRHRPSAPGRES